MPLVQAIKKRPELFKTFPTLLRIQQGEVLRVAYFWKP